MLKRLSQIEATVGGFFVLAVICIGVLMGGCDDAMPSATSVSGVVTDIHAVHEDSINQHIYVHFQDGRVVTFRKYYSKQLTFQKGKFNEIWSDSDGNILKVTIPQ
jgi:hypothetical protein